VAESPENQTPLAPKEALLQVVQRTDILLAVAVVAILIFMIMPLPTVMLDILLAINITCSLMILLIPMYALKPIEFSVFPGILLLVTLFRLSLNVASTRLILGEAYAGQVIESFGSFVVKGNYVVGLVIFVILIIINFVVITKGSGRIAEVAARFTLDAMPGKQMAIDADLNAGLLDEREARKRRDEMGSHYWRAATRHERPGSGYNLYHSHRGRWTRNSDPRTDHLDLGWHHRI